MAAAKAAAGARESWSPTAMPQAHFLAGITGRDMRTGALSSPRLFQPAVLQRPVRPLAMMQAVTTAAVKPVLECVVNNSGGSYTARFGYSNLNTVVVTIPVGANNKFTPTPIDRGQATVFQPGRQRFVFDVPFNGSNLVWSLKGPDNQNRTSTASSNSAACASNHPPVANAGPAQTVFVGTTVQLDGSGSTDADGDPLTYRWSFVSVPADSGATLTGATTVHPTFVVDKPGSYTVQLIVNDGKVDSTPATVVISTQNSPPVANAGPNQTVQTHATVQLDGSGSSDVDGDPLTYAWSFVSVPSGSAAALSNPTAVNPTFVTDKKGSYVVQLVVNDAHVNSAPAQVTISDVNSQPVANAGPNQTVATRTLVTLDGSGSTDVDGDPLTYTWAILSAPAGSTAALSDTHAVKPSFTVDVIGNYVIQLIVNDGTVNSTPATVTINDVNSPPVANAGPAQSVALGAIVTLDGTGSSDVDGQALSYSWSILSKPAGSAATLSQSASPNPFFTADKAGNYVIQLIVNDGIVNSQPATVTISTINSVPVANPGPSRTVSVGATVNLDGSGSSDADSDPLTYTWAILSQPAGGRAALSNAHVVNPVFTANVVGLYVVQLIVNDGKVDSPPVTASITAATPVLQLVAPPAATGLPGQSLSLVFSISNPGPVDAQQSVFSSGTATTPLGVISAGQTQPASVNFAIPAFAAKGNEETDAAYLSRLQQSENQSSPVSANVAWADPAGTAYGPVSAATSVTEQFAIITVGLSAPATAQAGDTISYTLTVNNVGHAPGTITGLSLTLPDGSLQNPALGPVLAAGASASATIPFHAPATQSGTMNATAQATWADGAASAYGPLSAVATTQINGVAPPVLASCLPSGSMSALVQNGSVTSYVPNGFWTGSTTGIRVVPIEGGGAPSLVPTPGVVNSCASNSVTGQTVCTANNTDVYVLSDSTLTNTLASGSTGTAHFSGGFCQTCGVAINAGTNQAVISVGLAAPNNSGIQLLDLATNTLAPPVPTSGVRISEDIAVDPTRNLILSASEDGVFEIFKSGSGQTQLFDRVIGSINPTQFQMDSTAIDCSTGIAMGSIEFPFDNFGNLKGSFVLADLTQATFVPGTPGTWSAPVQAQGIPELARKVGFAIAPGSHLGIATDEFGDTTFGAFRLPATSGSGVPAVQDWVLANFPNPGEPNGAPSFRTGAEPHTVTAYVSPTTGKAYGVIADDGAGFLQGDSNFLAVIDLQALLNAPRDSFGHRVASGVDLVATGIVRFVPTRTFLIFPASPNSGAQGTQNLAVTVLGANTHFAQGTTTASFGPGVTVASLTVTSPTSLTATVNIDPLANVGPRLVSVTTGAESLSMISTSISGFSVVKGPATVAQIVPSIGAQGQTVSVNVTGQSTHFAQGVTTANFSLGSFSSIASLTVNSPTSLTVTLNISPLEGTASNAVTIATGGEIINNGTFTISPGPAKLTNASPNGGPQGMQHLTVNITGQATHFQQGQSSLNMDGSFQVQGFTVNSPTSATAIIGISANANLGSHSLSVRTFGENAPFPAGFNVTPGIPTLLPLGVPFLPQGAVSTTVNINGEFTHFVQGTSLANFGPGVSVVSFTVSSPTAATATITVDPLAALGERNVTVTTGSEVAALTNGFSVNPGPAVISAFSPTSLAAGQQNMTVTLTGSSTHFAQGVSTAAFGPGITIDSLTVNSPTSATAVVSVSPAASGGRTIAVITSAEVAPSTGAFGIAAATATLTQLTPSSGQPGTQNLSVAITGLATHFVQGTSVASFGAGITVASLTVNSATSATAVINIDPAATLAARTVTVTTGVEAASFNNGFSVVPAPPTVSLNLEEGTEITAITPVSGSVSTGNWTLSYALASADGTGPAPVFVPFATGAAPVTNAVLGTLDPTLLLNGNYIIQLSSTDQFGQIATSSVNVEVSRNVKVGNFTLSFTDLNVPAPGLPISVTRTYDSRDKPSHDFGLGWTLSLVNVRLQKNGALGAGWAMTQSGSSLSTNFCVQEVKPHFVTITFPDGRVYKFHAVTQPQCQIVPIDSANLVFVQVPGTIGTLGATLQIFGSGSGANNVQVNPPSPGVVDLVDQTGQDSNPTVYQLTTAEGFTYVIDQNLGATSVTDPNGNTLTINASGITSSSGQNVVFTRDAQGRITQIADPNGNALTYSYDGLGNLSTFVDRVGNVTAFTYDPTHLLTNIVAPNGLQAVKNVYDPQGRLLSTTDASGKTITYTHALASNQEAVQDRLGNTSTYTYDADGNVTQTIDALGNVSSATFDGNDNKLTETVCTQAPPGCASVTTTYTYDSLGNRASETDSLQNQTTYTYSPFRQPLVITDPLHNPTTNVYDSKGNLQSTQDAVGNLTQYTNNAQGQPLTIKDALGGLTTFAYDGNGRVTQQTDALNNLTAFTYDANGNKLSQAVTRTKSDGTKETLATQYQYDANGRLAKTTNPDGTFTQTVYNSLGKTSDTFDALNRKTHYDYDANGRLTKTTYPDSTFETITYDANDRRLTSTDRAGHTTSYTYDAIGRLTKTTFVDTSSTQTVYDAAGRTIQTIDPLNNTTSFGYDAASRRTSVTDALQHTTNFGYDAAGNQTSITDALQHTTTFVYDSDNRRLQTVYPDQTTDSVGYDALGRQASKTDQAGKITQYGYDPVGRLTTVTQFLNNNPLVTSYAYDEIGNRISQTDANNHVTKFAYDQLGRRITRTLPLSMTESYGYDAVGNLTSKKDFNGHTTTYQYDTLNRLTTKIADLFFSAGACAGGACGATQIGFTYTANGRRLSMTDASGTTNYTYDTRNRLLTKAAPAGTLTYTYDAAGNTLTLKSSNAGGASMTYAYDVLNRLSSVTDASGVTNYSYDTVGNLSGYTYPNGVATSYTYDTLNRLTNMQSLCGTGTPACAPGTMIASYAYTLGAAGNRLSVAELGGRTVNYTYDDLYRLTSETISGAATQNGTIGYTFDAVGNRTQRNSAVPAIPATGLLNYDANDRTSTDPYDANGSLLSSGAGANVYDFENRLVQAGGVKLVYDGDGNRVKETVATTTTSFLVADQNLTGYAQVLDELQSGAVSRTYSNGLSPISQRLTAIGQGLSFYGFDGHGSVRNLTSTAGLVTDTYDYDAFGNLIASTGSTPNNYLFAGEQFDPSLGIYFMRARYYDQRLGRFWTMDTYEGDPQAPLSLHKYLYAGANPVDHFDPSGKDFELGSVTTALGNALTIAGRTVIQARIVLTGLYYTLGPALPLFVEKGVFWAIVVVLGAHFGLSALSGGLRAVDRLMLNAQSYKGGPFSAGWATRGMQAGRAAGQNLGDTFPVFDDFDFQTGEGSQVFSTNQIRTPQALIQAIGDKAAAFEQGFQEHEDVFRGYDSSGGLIEFQKKSVTSRNLVVITPPIGNFPLSRVAADLENLETLFGLEDIAVLESESFIP
jgi:RHS repeat-associated protein/uncharacterized repeat protein (TIGR01451 family)